MVSTPTWFQEFETQLVIVTWLGFAITSGASWSHARAMLCCSINCLKGLVDNHQVCAAVMFSSLRWTENRFWSNYPTNHQIETARYFLESNQLFTCTVCFK